MWAIGLLPVNYVLVGLHFLSSEMGLRSLTSSVFYQALLFAKFKTLLLVS